MQGMQYDEGYDDEQQFIRDSVRLIVEEQEDSLVLTYADLEPHHVYDLTIMFIGRLADMTGQTYNQVCNDLKEIGEE